MSLDQRDVFQHHIDGLAVRLDTDEILKINA
jgi:hypothetical protein